MNKLKWKIEYSTGEDSLDHEHKILLDIMVKIDLADENFQTLEKILNKLKKYAKAHFINEESYMEAIGFKDLSSHKKTHQELFEKFICLSDTNKFSTEKKFKEELIYFFKNIFLQHVLVDDAKIYQHVKENLKP